MSSDVPCHRVILALILLGLCLLLTLNFNSYPFSFHIFRKMFSSQCFKWGSSGHQLSYKANRCMDYTQIKSFVWTYNGTGIMKYIQWIITRKLENIRITRLNDNCKIMQENYFSSEPMNDKFVQIYIMSLSAKFNQESECITKINQLISRDYKHINHIYFKRKSIIATFLFQQLDLLKYNFNVTRYVNVNTSFEDDMKNFTNHLKMKLHTKFNIVNSEDLIKTNLTDCEKYLVDFISLLGLNASSLKLQHIIQYDSHQFIADSTWWDQSDVAEHVWNMSIPSPPLNFTYSNDFYHLHGNRSFLQYLSDSRQCFNDGIFAQMQSETVTNRISTDKPNRCLSKKFDCAFSDLYSLEDRNQLYQTSNKKPLKCGFTTSSIFDQVRSQYGRNHTCQTIVFTCVTNCYDPLPQIEGAILPSFCFVALIDKRTRIAYEKLYQNSSILQWDLFELYVNITLFRIMAKSAETLKIVGQRMFPLAKWIIWVDGKGNVKDIAELLKQARAPVIGAPHPDRTRTSASEVSPTIGRVAAHENPVSQRLKETILEIKLQEKEYQTDGFYQRSDQLKLKMFDIAIFLYRNNHPCIFRYLCGWHNEVNYFSYRGQLSVFYSAVRLNLTSYLHFLPQRFYSTFPHQGVC